MIEGIYGNVNTFLFIKSNECLIIDPGYNHEKIKRLLVERNLNPLGMVLTHGHFDHIKDCNEFDLPIFIHEYDQELLYDPKKNYSAYFTSEVKIKEEKHINFIDEHTTDILGFKVEIIHTPGHSRGSICLYLREIKQLIVGDLLSVRKLNKPQMIYGGETSFIENIKKKIFSLPSDTILLNGHGENTTLNDEINDMYYRKEST